jgi:hypothetical protein
MTLSTDDRLMLLQALDEQLARTRKQIDRMDACAAPRYLRDEVSRALHAIFDARLALRARVSTIGESEAIGAEPEVEF